MDIKVYFLQIPIPVIWYKYLYHTDTEIDVFLFVAHINTNTIRQVRTFDTMDLVSVPIWLMLPFIL